jgi:hypothetical protein
MIEVAPDLLQRTDPYLSGSEHDALGRTDELLVKNPQQIGEREHAQTAQGNPLAPLKRLEEMRPASGSQ